MPSPINDVSDTALWVAVYRADETKRADALFKDPLAEKLAGHRGREIARKMSGAKYTDWNVVIRTTIIDEYLQSCLIAGADTIINLGAGLDTRPYRMNLPKDLRWVEVDYPHLVEYKKKILGTEVPRCRLERVGLDLSDASARQMLFAQLAGESRMAVILTEGVVPYLSVEQVKELAEELRSHKSFRFWILEYISPFAMNYLRNKRRLKEMRNAPFLFQPPEWKPFFASTGWQPTRWRYLAEQSKSAGRPVPRPWYYPLIARFLKSNVIDEINKSSAYVMLEPK